MKVISFLLILIGGLFTPVRTACSSDSLSLLAQVTSDGTTNTTVNQSGNNFNILNGVEKGNNLFHSFSNFSVPTGGSANFDLINTPNITTIFSRVTGGTVSNIDGLIQTFNSNNPVSLFLMNPAGIIFGQNASLNIGGSFIGTTANSIKFADGVEFSTTNPAAPLLTMSVPIGLQMGQNPAEITIQGAGHPLTLTIPVFSPFIPTGATSGIGVNPGKTLALVGGNITLAGGNISAKQGRIELGSVAQGVVNLSQIDQGWSLSYGDNLQYRDIDLSQKALVDTSGVNSGAIQVQARNLSLQDGSVILSQNQGPQTSGSLTVKTTDSINLIGTSPDGQIYSGLFTENLNSGSGGKITVSTQRLLLQNGGSITAAAFGTGDGGDIEVHAATLVQLSGLPLPGSLDSRINALTFNSGKAGDVQILTGQLQLRDGGTINSITFSPGLGGKVNINATDMIDVAGADPVTFSTSVISAATFGGGNADNLIVNTRKLVVRDGGRVTTSTFAAGDAGNLFINATDSIEVSGKFSGLINPSLIDSSANVLNEVTRNLFRLPPQPTGNSGNVTVNTPDLSVKDGGLISVNNQGSGDSGLLQVSANNVFLDNQGALTGSTFFGQGGNILIQANTLLLRHNSQLTATALGGQGNGGNVTINSPIIVGLENSDIVANAFQGKGGNINISTQGIFGLKYRNQLTDNSDITASSQFGVDGTVEINSFGVDPSSGLVELPGELTDPSQQIATGCLNTTNSSFVATGRGGIPQNPNQQIGSDVYDGLRLRTWSDIRDISAYRRTSTVKAQIPQSPETLMQATSWRRNAQGKVELFADKSPIQRQQILTCAAISR